MFTVVIPLYNKEKYIKVTLESVLMQTFQNYEVLVVNDGSTDNSVQVVESIQDSRIKLFHKVNGGVCSARNYGIERASNQYIAFLDADDTWEPNFLETFYNAIQKNITCKVFCSNFREGIGGNAAIKGVSTGYMENYFTIFMEQNQTPVWSSAVVVDKEVFEICGCFDLRMKNGEDLHMWFRMADIFPIYYISVCLAVYNLDNAKEIAYAIFKKDIRHDLVMYIKELNLKNDLWERFKDYYICRNIKPYFLSKKNHKIALDILKGVNFKHISLINRMFFRFPRPLMSFLYSFYFRCRYT